MLVISGLVKVNIFILRQSSMRDVFNMTDLSYCKYVQYNFYELVSRD